MDPLSQGIVGATASQLVSSRKSSSRTKIFHASWMGFLAGMAADLDVLIRSKSDPLLALEYHRQFTHSLIFIPVGALLCAIVFYTLYARKHFSFTMSYLFCFAGYATHALLDACTTYGTQLFWPFSDMRVAWNNVSVIDPLFTLPALVFISLAIIKKARVYSYCAFIYAIAYLLLGVIQHDRALVIANDIAQTRQHTPMNIDVKPTLGNLLVWKSIYEYKEKYYVDAVRVGLTSQMFVGDSIDKFNQTKHMPWLEPQSQQANDLARFYWFSAGYLGVSKENPLRIIDMRYSLTPNDITGMWGLELNPKASSTQHAHYFTKQRDAKSGREGLTKLWGLIIGNND